jgi:hypothetical protein
MVSLSPAIIAPMKIDRLRNFHVMPPMVGGVWATALNGVYNMMRKVAGKRLLALDTPGVGMLLHF